jgi:hypothetical protein
MVVGNGFAGGGLFVVPAPVVCRFRPGPDRRLWPKRGVERAFYRPVDKAPLGTTCPPSRRSFPDNDLSRNSNKSPWCGLRRESKLRGIPLKHDSVVLYCAR